MRCAGICATPLPCLAAGVSRWGAVAGIGDGSVNPRPLVVFVVALPVSCLILGSWSRPLRCLPSPSPNRVSSCRFRRSAKWPSKSASEHCWRLKVETESSLTDSRKKGRDKKGSNDDVTVERCASGSCQKSISEDQANVIAGSDAAAEMGWEEGHVVESKQSYSHELGETVTVEFTDVPSSTNKKSAQRPAAEEKELAKLVYKVHLLCLIARGRVIDKACNGPLIQASILSLVPYHLMCNVVDVPKLKAVNLHGLVSWWSCFQKVCQVVDQISIRTLLEIEGTHYGDTRLTRD